MTQAMMHWATARMVARETSSNCNGWASRGNSDDAMMMPKRHDLTQDGKNPACLTLQPVDRNINRTQRNVLKKCQT